MDQRQDTYSLLVQLVTSEPRVRRVVEAGEEATAVMSRLHALETRSTKATTSNTQRFRARKRQNTKKFGVMRRTASRSQHSRCKLHNWVGSLHDNLTKVLEVAEAKEGRRSWTSGMQEMSQETVDDFRDTDRRLYQVLTAWSSGDRDELLFATLKDQESRRGSRCSDTWIQRLVQRGWLHIRV